MMTKNIRSILILLLCCCAVSAMAVSSPTLQNFSGSGIRKKESPGKLQKTLLSAMRAAGSTQLEDIITKSDTVVDEFGNSADISGLSVDLIFTPETYHGNKDGSCDLQIQLADANAFKTADGMKEVFLIVGIPQKNPASGKVPIKCFVLPAEVKDGKVTAHIPAETLNALQRASSAGWNCVCMIASRNPAPALFFEIPSDEDAITV